MLILFSERINYTCVHCNALATNDIESVISHCKTCVRMPRENPYRSKFVCNQCTYATYTGALIKSHIFQHYGIKPFHCDVCKQDFTLKCNLNKHLREKHNFQTS
uniref:Zinc finger protein 40 n=1 Tax=Cacopsylla melanoneura TaxID=428564 RepID=A0A8D8YZG6_9HEMI